MCEHRPNQITFHKGRAFIDLVTKDIMVDDSFYSCECGESFSEDPNDEPDENLRQELSKELH